MQVKLTFTYIIWLKVKTPVWPKKVSDAAKYRALDENTIS